MRLRNLMQDMYAINLLKSLQEIETALAQTYIEQSKLQEKYENIAISTSLDLLDTAGLILRDQNNNIILLSISTKGKELLAHIDGMISLLNGKSEPVKRIKIEYENMDKVISL